MSLAYIDPSDRPKERGPYPTLRDSRTFSQHMQTASPPGSPHREEEQDQGDFDIRADFEGRGPKYSHVYGLWNETVADDRE